MDKDSLFARFSRQSHASGAGRRHPDLCNGDSRGSIRLSRSAFDHSMNYRSLVAFRRARKIVDPEQKINSLRVISEHLIPGRWQDVRGPSEKELKATTVLEFSIEEASSKVRSGPPLDDESDYGLPVWAGILPLETKSRPPVPGDKLIESATLPDYVWRYDRINGRKDG